MARPICVHCGNPYGKRETKTVAVKCKVGEEMPPYRGNGVVVKTSRYNTGGSIGQTIGGLQFETNEIVETRTIWDGESWWGGYDPFCTLRCALDYARRAYARAQQSSLKRVG